MLPAVIGRPATRASALACVAVFTLVACSGNGGLARRSLPSVPAPTSPPTPGGIKVATEAFTGTKGGAHSSSYRLEYPRLEGMADGARQKVINDKLQSFAETRVRTFLEAAGETPTTTKPATDSDHGELTGTVTTTLLDDRAASFRIDVSEYQAGAAHPAEEVNAFTFDLASGKQLAITDLFRTDSGYLDFLSHGAVEQLIAASVYDENTGATGTAPNPTNFQTFNLTATGLDVTFQQYQVAAGAAGAPKVTYAYAQLRPYAAPGGPLAGR
jgi:uncharacterized protein DUF3298